MASRNFACILAGGSGERFWPMSREARPKHLLKLLSDRTLIEETVLRLEGVVPRENVFVLTGAAQLEGIRAALKGVPAEQIVAEPARRDTAPAAALATALARSRNPQAVVALFPADALIHDRKRFAAQLANAFDFAAGGDGTLVTFGVKPTIPATGFGYLELGDPIRAGPNSAGVFQVRRFVEKPDAAKAKRYLESGKYAWNAGIFLWAAASFLAEAEKNAPELAAFIRDFPDGDPASYLAAKFPSLPKISVDYAIMEKAAKVATVLAEFDWDDVGSWAALPRHMKADESGNFTLGALASVDASGNVTVSNGRVIALCGVKDLVVVETPDAVLVCSRDSAQSVKKLLPKLPENVR